MRGDHYVTLVVQVPTRLSEEAKEALRDFDMASGNSLGARGEGKKREKKKSFMDKVKEAFEDKEE